MDRKIGCVIVNYNTADQTIELARTLNKYGTVAKIVVVDNCSLSSDYEKLCKIDEKNIHLIRLETNRGYGYGNNKGIQYLANEFALNYVMICNPDTLITENAIFSCVNTLYHQKDVVAVAPMAKNIDGLFYPSTWKVPTKEEYIFSKLKFLGRFFSIKKDLCVGKGMKEVDCISGALLIIDVAKFMKVGLYDEKLFLYCEETLLGIKFRKANYKSFLLLDAYYCHNHVYKKESNKVILLRLRRTLNSRMYLLRNYYKVNFFWRCIAKISFVVVIFESWFLLNIASLKK